MATVTRSRPRVKPARSCRLRVLDGGARMLSIVMGSPPRQSETHYHLTEMACDWGRGFEVRKFSTGGSTVYHVHIDPSLGDSCDCRGFIRHGHCKHRDCLAELVRRGLV